MHPQDHREVAQDSAAARHQCSRWFRTPEASAYTKHGESTLNKLRVTGGGPPYLKRGAVVLYDRDDVVAGLPSGRCATRLSPRGPPEPRLINANAALAGATQRFIRLLAMRRTIAGLRPKFQSSTLP